MTHQEFESYLLIARVFLMYYAVFAFGEARVVVLYGDIDKDRNKYYQFVYKGVFVLITVLDSYLMLGS